MRSPRHVPTSLAPALVLCAALAGPASAQRPDVPRNVRVRLTLSGGGEERVVGVVQPGAGDTLMVRTRDTVAAIARARVERVEVAMRGSRHTYAGMLIGFAAGAAAGGFAGVTCPEDCQPEMPLILGAAGGGVGMLVGGAIGALSRTETWMDANAAPASISAGPAPGSRGVALGLSLRTR